MTDCPHVVALPEASGTGDIHDSRSNMHSQKPKSLARAPTSSRFPETTESSITGLGETTILPDAHVETGIGTATVLTTVTQWVENPTGGRERGPIALARAWLEVLVRPRRFFRTGVAPGDQAPGLVFVCTVVFVFEATRFALVPGSYPVVAGRPLVSAVLWLIVAVAFVAPLVLHLVAAIETVALVLLVDNRAGVSKTVQIIAYASAPCVFAGLPIPVIRVMCTAYGAALLVVGTSEVHDIGFGRAAIVGALPAVLVFGYAFGGFGAAASLLVFV